MTKLLLLTTSLLIQPEARFGEIVQAASVFPTSALCRLLQPPALPVVLNAADLDALRRTYDAKKIEVNRARRDGRHKAIEKKIVPILNKIAALKSDEAVAFLSRIVETEVADLAAAACKPLATTGDPAAVEALLKAAQSRPEAVREAALGGLRDAKAKLTEIQIVRVRAFLQGSHPKKVTVAAVRLLGAQDTVPAAQALLQTIGANKVGGEIARAAEGELSKSKNRNVLTYLFEDALGGGVRAPAQLAAILRVAAAKKAKEAAAAAKRLLSHRSPEVAAAAVSALAAIGFEGGKDQIFKLLKKWRSNIDPAVELLASLAESTSPGTAQILIDVSREFSGALQIASISLLGRAKSDAALERLIEALGDKDLYVRTAAMKAIRQYKDKRVIGPLIGVMERDDGRLRGEAYKFLIEVTGQSMGPSPADWKKWWSYAQRDFTFKPVVEGRTSVAAAKYYGIEIFSKRLCFIIDRSSSMTQQVTDPKTKKKSTRIKLAKKELIKTLKELKAGTAVNIISFDANYRAMAKTLTLLTRTGRAKALKWVQVMKTGHGTNIYDTLSMALKDKRVDTIFLLSDGLPSRGKYTDPATILREIRKQNLVRNVTINTIAIGIEQDLMKKLAKENGGKYVFVKD